MYCEGNTVSYTDPFGLSPEIQAERRKKKISETAHFILDAGGMIPVVGMVFDGTNFIVYTLEGDAFGASMSAVAFVPYVGEVSGATKLTAKTAKYAGKAWKVEEAFVLTSRYADDAAELSYKLLKKEGRYLDDDIVKAVRDIHYSAYADNWWVSMNPICITVLEDNTMILSKNRGKLPKKAIERANEILSDVEHFRHVSHVQQFKSFII